MADERMNEPTLNDPEGAPHDQRSSQARLFNDSALRVTQGQLDAVAMRCREELAVSLRREGTDAVATLKDNVLIVRVEHSLAAAEQHLMRRGSGRAFFQHYIEELAEQMHPDFKRHVEHILPYTVTYVRVVVDCDNDCIHFRFGLYPRPYSVSGLNDVDASFLTQI